MKKIFLFISITITVFQASQAQPFNRYARLDGIDDFFDSNFSFDYYYNASYGWTLEFFYRYCTDTAEPARGLFSLETVEASDEKYNDYGYLYEFMTLGVHYNNIDYFYDNQLTLNTNWTHFAVTWDAYQNKVRFWYNGYGIGYVNANSFSPPEAGFYLGQLSGFLCVGSNFKGYMDEVRISDVTRYTTVYTPPTAPFTPDSATLALWHFDEPEYMPATIADSSGYGWDLNAHGGVTLVGGYNATITGDSITNSYGSFTYYMPAFPDYYNTAWHVTNGVITANFSDTVTVQWDSVGSGSISVDVMDTVTGCDGSSAQLDVTVVGCQATFILSPDSVPHHYWGYDMSAGIPPMSYNWNWGDGAFDTIQFPSHTYSAAGFYTICLTIQDSVGCTSNFCPTLELQKMTGEQAENTIVTVDIVPSIPTSVQNVAVLQSLNVYPNPVQQSMSLDYTLTAAAHVGIRLYDVLGNEVDEVLNADQQTGAKHLALNTGKLPDGIYLLRINTGDQIVVKRVVVMK